MRGLATYGQAVILAKIGNNLVARYQQRLFDHLMKLDIGFFNENRSGYLAAQINQNVAGIRDLMGMTLTTVARDVVSLIGLVDVMVVQDPVLSIIAFLIGPPLVFAVDKLMRRLRRITRESVEINSRLIGAMQEATQGITVVKAFTMESQLSRKMAELIGDAEARSNKIARVSERLTPIAEMLAGLAIAGVIAYAGYRSAYGDQMPGAVLSFITALLLAYDPARRLAKVQVSLERSLVNARMIYEILDLEPRQGDAPDATALVVGKGEVRFADVSFGYSDGMPVLHGVSFVAEAGKTTAIVGASGAGKSTLTALLERFHDLGGGTIAIDGQDIAQVTKTVAAQRHRLCVAAALSVRGHDPRQHPLRPRDASDAEVEEAARLAAADDFIRQQADGYDTLVGENGVTLSGGQRQRLSIARAIVRQRADPAARRGDVGARHRIRGARAGGARAPSCRAAPSSSSRTACRRWSTPTASSCWNRAAWSRKARIRRCWPIRMASMRASHRVQNVKGLGLVDDIKHGAGRASRSSAPRRERGDAA